MVVHKRIARSVKKAVTKVKSTVRKVASKVKSTVKKAATRVKTALKKTATKAKSTVSRVKSTVRKVTSKAKSTAKRATTTVKTALKKTATIARDRGLAAGEIFNRGPEAPEGTITDKASLLKAIEEREKGIEARRAITPKSKQDILFEATLIQQVEQKAKEDVINSLKTPSMAGNIIERIQDILTRPVPGLPPGTQTGVPPLLVPGKFGVTVGGKAIQFAKNKGAAASGIGKLIGTARLAINPKTQRVVTNVLLTLGVGMFGISLAKDWISQRIFGGFIGTEEAVQNVGYVSSLAIQSGNLTLAERAMDAEQEVYDAIPSLNDEIPWKDSKDALEVFAKAGQTALQIKREIVANERLAQENGEDDRAYWERVNQKKINDEVLLIDYYNEQRRQQVEWELDAKEDAREDEAEFWEQERNKTSLKEEKDREAIAEFWLAYKKEIKRLQEGSSPSNLNFGLL